MQGVTWFYDSSLDTHTEDRLYDQYKHPMEGLANWRERTACHAGGLVTIRYHHPNTF